MHWVCLGGLCGHLEVVLFRYGEDNVHHIRNAAGAFAALVQFPVDHGGDDDPLLLTVAEQAVRSQEDRLLDRMEETDTLASELKAAEASSKSEQAEVAREKQALDAELGRDEQELQRLADERTRVAAALSAAALSLFEHVSKHRRGLALSEAREGHCTACHVRLRPQVFNEVRRNDGLIQCESCSRILYFIPSAAASPAPQAS